jgi:esterase FrsA
MYEYLGPPFEEGPLPAVFYFALSAHDSLHLDPFNQPARFLSSYPLRVFSLTLPGHHLAATEALGDWAREIKKGNNLLETFYTKAVNLIEQLVAQKVITKGKLGIAGLSRGGFIGCHVAARTPLISHILGFAPLTKLSHLKEFEGMDVEPLELSHLVPQLSNRHLRFYIGNRDTRVGTEHCYHFFSSLVEEAHHKKIRSAPLELIIGPSVGHQGHGTLPPVFRAGATWLAEQLGCAHG